MTYYRREEDKSLSIKLEGQIKDVPLFEQVCVIKEVDLHYKWAPFCSSSLTIADLDKIDVVGWFLIGMPNFGLARDGCFRAIGCDNIAEDNTIILAAQGVNDIKPGAPSPEDTYLRSDPILGTLDIPPVPKRRGSGRMTIRKFEALITVTSPTSANTRIVANIDPNLSLLPQSLLDFIMKHLAGVMLGKLQGAARKAVKNPQRNEHAQRMRQEEEFYRKWLMAKFQAFCEEKGWEMPHVSAFDYVDVVGAPSPAISQRKIHRSQTYAGGSTETETEAMENMSTLSTPNPIVPTDDLSELTSRSGISSVWKNNPIAAYMREVEERTKQRKAAHVAASREMAAERLKPKHYTPEKEERLRELREAKARRLAEKLSASKPPSQTMTLPSRTSAQVATIRLHSHSALTKILVITMLVALLFVMLHPESFLALSPIIKENFSSWWLVAVEDLLAVCYILLCSVPHFLLCEVALVYTFGSLDLGKKSGATVQRFYSDRIRLGVAVFSLSIVAIGIVKAVVKAWLRMLLLAAFRAFREVRDVLFGWMDGAITWHTRLPLPPGCRTAWSLLTYGWVAVFRVLQYLLDILVASIVRSNFVGREAEYFALRLWGLTTHFARRVMNQWIGLAQDSGDDLDAELTRVSWRVEAFDTAGTLFTYTAVFLLLVLLLFTVATKRYSSGVGKAIAEASPLQPGGAGGGQREITAEISNVSSISDGSAEERKAGRSPTQYSSIPEEDEAVFTDGFDQSPVSSGARDASTTGPRRFGFGKRRRTRTVALTSSVSGRGVSGQGSRLRKSGTF